jgi:hypothetical protein
LDLILERRGRNKQLADEDERANIANSLIRHRLTEIRRQGRQEGLDFSQVVKEVLAAYQLTDALNRSPRQLYQLMSIARSVVLVRRDFYAFAPFIVRAYHRME